MRHPDTGKCSLYVNPVYTRFLVGIPPEESELILPYLFRHCTNPHFVYRHRWREGDVVIWDNRTTLHLAVDAYQGARRMHRVSILENPNVAPRRAPQRRIAFATDPHLWVRYPRRTGIRSDIAVAHVPSFIRGRAVGSPGFAHRA